MARSAPHTNRPAVTDRPEPTTPTGKPASRDPVADLRAQLAERDRQLANLTEQSLRVLDELASARQNPPDRPEALARIASLQELLADTRARVRTSSRAILVAGAPAAPVVGDVDVVLWDLPPQPQLELQRYSALLQQRITVLMGPDQRAEDCQGVAATWSVHGTSCRRPAHFWNEAMATTQTDVVVFVARGVELTGEAIARLAAAARAEGVALCCPRLQDGNQDWLGRQERDLLDVRPRPCAVVPTSTDVPFASPEAFALLRTTFERVGPFDQDFGWDLALADWTARAAGHSLRCIGVADAIAKCPSLRGPAAGGLEEADRIVFFARHRPQQLMTAALAGDVLWQLEPDLLANAIRAVLLRLPRANEMPAAVDLLVQQAQTVASWKRLAPSVRERIAGLCRELQIPTDGARSDASLLPLVERAQGAVASLQQRVANGEIVQGKLRAVEAELETTVGESRRLESTLKDEMIARSNTIDALRNELLERERAIAALRQDLGHRQGEVQRFVDHLSQQQQEVLRLQELKAVSQGEVERLRSVESDLARMQGERSRLLEQLEAKRSSTIELERTLRAQMEAQQARHVELMEAQQARHAELMETEQERHAELLETEQGRHAELLRAEAQRRDQQLTAEREGRIAVEREVAVQAERAQTLQKRLAASEQSRRELDDQLQVALNGRLCAESESVATIQAITRLQEERRLLEATHSADEKRIGALEGMVRELENNLGARDRELEARTQVRAQLELELSARTAKLAESSANAAELTQSVRDLQSKSAAGYQELQQAGRERDSVRLQLAEAQQALQALRAERIRQVVRVEDLSATLTSREDWIGKLLEEVTKRRLHGRALLPHEVEFLERLRTAARP